MDYNMQNNVNYCRVFVKEEMAYYHSSWHRLFSDNPEIKMFKEGSGWFRTSTVLQNKCSITKPSRTPSESCTFVNTLAVSKM